MAKLPYSEARAGQARETEIRNTLRGVGASAVGFMVDDDADKIVVQFRLRGREITVPVAIGAYAEAWLRENPHTARHKSTLKEYRAKARETAERACWAILADWIKAQAAMMTCGLLDADSAFLAHIHLPDGRRVVEAITTAGDGPILLPPPKEASK